MGFAEKERQRREKGVVSKIVSDPVVEPGDNPEAGAEHAQPVVKKKPGRPKVNRETKKKVTLTLMPSTYEKASKIAYADGMSASELIDKLLADYVKKNSSKLD